MALVAALAVALAAGLAWRATNGRMRPAQASARPDAWRAAGRRAGVTGTGVTEMSATAAGATDLGLAGDAAPADGPRSRLTAADLGQPLGERATLVQFSSAFCAPCRATRVILADVAGRAPGIGHVEIDAESHLDLVRALGVLRTPTVFVLAADGAITARASGQPRKADVIGALGAALSAVNSYSPGLEAG